MKGAARQPRAYGTNPAITPKLAPVFPFPLRGPRAAPPCRIDRRLVAGGCRGDDLCRRLRHRRHRDELRNVGVALPQPIFRQRHLYLGRADLDGADRAHGGLFSRRHAGRSHRLPRGACAHRDHRITLSPGVAGLRAGSLISALALMFFPVTFLGMYSPFAIRLLLRSAQRSGRVSGAVYGISTAGAIVGTLGTTFFLIPMIGSRAITLTLGAHGLAAGSALLALARLHRRAGAALVVIALAAPTAPAGRADNLIDEGIRVAML